MKGKALRFIFSVIVMFGSILACTAKAPGGRLVGYEFRSHGMAAVENVCDIFLNKKDGTLTVSFGTRGIGKRPRCMNTVKTVHLKSDELLRRVEKMLYDCNAHRWKSYYTNHDVLDGNSWSLTLTYEDEVKTTGGYAARPKNNCMNEINGLIREAVLGPEQ